MTDLLTQITRVKELRDKAEKGPIRVYEEMDAVYVTSPGWSDFASFVSRMDSKPIPDGLRNANFFAAAANLDWPAIQAMAEENEKLRAWKAEAIKILRFYGCEPAWSRYNDKTGLSIDFKCDKGQRARAFLKGGDDENIG